MEEGFCFHTLYMSKSWTVALDGVGHGTTDIGHGA